MKYLERVRHRHYIVAIATVAAISIVVIATITNTVNSKNNLFTLLRDIQHNLALPKGSHLLYESIQSPGLHYGKGCVGASLMLSFGTSQSLTEVVTFFRQQLSQQGFTNAAGHTISDTFLVAKKNENTYISVSDGSPDQKPLFTPVPGNERYTTLYDLHIHIVNPGYQQCVG